MSPTMPKSALIAVDPCDEKGWAFERFAAVVRLFQERTLIGHTSVASVVHPDLDVYPRKWFAERRRHLIADAQARVAVACADAFDVDTVDVLASESSANERLVSRLCRHARRAGHDLIILGSNDRSGLPQWLLGSFSETAALTTALPLLIIKPHVQPADFARSVRLVVGVDATSPPPAAVLRWIAGAAKPAGAQVDLVYVEPRLRPGIDALRWRKAKAEAAEVLGAARTKLRAAGVKASVVLLDETASMAQSIVDYAEARKVWVTLMLRTPRSFARRILLGSTARQVLALTRRPFLSLGL